MLRHQVPDMGCAYFLLAVSLCLLTRDLRVGPPEGLSVTVRPTPSLPDFRVRGPTCCALGTDLAFGRDTLEESTGCANITH